MQGFLGWKDRGPLCFRLLNHCVITATTILNVITQRQKFRCATHLLPWKEAVLRGRDGQRIQRQGQG